MSIGSEARRRATDFYNRVGDLIEIMPAYELAAWRAWEVENVDGGEEVASSDWPGIDKYRPYLSVPIPDYRRHAVPVRIRQQVLERDDFICQHCGTGQRLTIDHVKPVVLGGGNGAENLQALCKSCNSRKGAR